MIEIRKTIILELRLDKAGPMEIHCSNAIQEDIGVCQNAITRPAGVFSAGRHPACSLESRVIDGIKTPEFAPRDL